MLSLLLALALFAERGADDNGLARDFGGEAARAYRWRAVPAEWTESGDPLAVGGGCGGTGSGT